MKLIKQTVLHYQDDRSDKVYEVDLCEVAADQYVVNFRYGRRGSNLRDGTKTAMPVTRVEAERVFDKLVASKVNKGYRSTGGASAGAAAAGGADAGAGAGAASGQSHAESVLWHLRNPSGEWPLDRVIWRCGELRIREAEADLLELFARGKPTMRAYCLCWALGRCGGEASFAPLRAVIDRGHSSGQVTRIAGEALRAINPDYKAELIDKISATIPGKDPASFAGRLAALLEDQADRAAQFLYPLYLIDTPEVRAGLIAALEVVPLIRPFFGPVRSIFKAAEFRGDAEMFGIVARRFDTTSANPGGWYARDMPFKQPTRDYLRRRVWRTLRKLGDAGSDEYAKMAVGVLLPFTDDDRARVTTRNFYGYHDGRWGSHQVHYPPFGGYWALSHILYGRSERYVSNARSRFNYAAGITPNAQPGGKREESYPEIWDRNPAALLHLLDESACEIVHEFAVRVLRANKTILAELDVDAIVMMLGRPYAVTADLGFELAQNRYDPAAPDLELVRGVAGCASERGRAAAHAWLRAGHRHMAADSALWAMLITSPHADNREFALEHLLAVGLDDDVARLVIGRAIARLKELEGASDEHLASAAAALRRLFARQLRVVGEPVIRDLLAHPALPVQQLAAEILLDHETLGKKPPDDILLGFLESEHASIRGIGGRLMSQLSDDDLLARSQLIVALSTSEHADLRDSIRPALLRLARNHPALARELAAGFARKLLTKMPEGVPSHLLALLRDELVDYLGQLGEVDVDMVMRLLKARSPHAQELGGLLLQRIDANELALSQIITLASHDILEVRRGARKMIDDNMDRLRLAMQGAVRLLDARWEDSRAWARELFETRLGADELTPSILVAVCDSIRPEVQAFGRKLITKYFKADDGSEYLLKLSEHPTADLQRFATTYLEAHAADNPERLAELEPFFVAILSRVFKGRIAKLRVIAFLSAEAKKSREAAAIAARVFARQSATMAITHKEPMIAAMVDIADRYPDIALPIRRVEAPLRGV